MIQFDDKKREKQIKELHIKEERALVRMLSVKYGLPYIEMSSTPISNLAVSMIKEDVARDALVGSFKIVKKTLHIAVFSPENKKVALVLQEVKNNGYTAVLYMTSRDQLEIIWKRYKDLSFTQTTEKGVLSVQKEAFTEVVKKTKNIDGIKKYTEQMLTQKGTHRVSKILEFLIAGAFSLGASDIHTEAQEDCVRVRYRLDGVLCDVVNVDKKTYKLLLARLKLLSGLKLNVDADTQDGRFSVKLGETTLQIRTSLLPGSFGENVVLRLLDPRSITRPLPKLGMNEFLLSIVQKEIRKPNGMILTTGPTGSGKTTTLYALLKTIYNPGIKIITIEDPVEYHIKGISQTQVDKNTNYTFLNGLRAALRQDPDVIMIGEIRDSETAKIAINASLTGHLVFSTLHTNNASGTIPRLIDLGINPKVIGSALLASMAQRLMRRLCVSCKKAYTPEKTEFELITKILAGANKKEKKDRSFKQLWEAVGCGECNNTGYRGRVGIYEAVLMDSAVRSVISSSPSEKEIAKITEPQCILNMTEDGIVKIVNGETSVEELRRVINIEDSV
ncbi:MAG: type II/IV secretion system protein [Methanosarcinales archaeon]|nr:type II/IV secretion system protein [Methanosarcinales archaeon]